MRIVLTHIPRTGGTSLFRALRDQVPEANAIEFQYMGQVATISDKELNRYEIISTYIGSRIFDRLDGSWTKIVILRDPITRLKSSYWNLRNNSECISFATPFAKSRSFAAYLASREQPVIVQATNVQVWSVLGEKGICFRRKHAHLGDNEICKLSLDRLATYDFVGFTEHLDELWRRVCEYLRWPVTQLPRLRRSSVPYPGEEAAPEDVSFHTSLDCELVRRALIVHGTEG